MNVDRQVLKHEIADLARKRVWVRADVVINKLAPKFTGSYQFIHASYKVVEIVDTRGAIVELSRERVVEKPAKVKNSYRTQ
jgi:hypothetical protein